MSPTRAFLLFFVKKKMVIPNTNDESMTYLDEMQVSLRESWLFYVKLGSVVVAAIFDLRSVPQS